MFSIIYDLVFLEISKKVVKKVVKPYIINPTLNGLKYLYNRYTIRKYFYR